jgi:hypothetical protein
LHWLSIQAIITFIKATMSLRSSRNWAAVYHWSIFRSHFTSIAQQTKEFLSFNRLLPKNTHLVFLLHTFIFISPIVLFSSLVPPILISTILFQEPMLKATKFRIISQEFNSKSCLILLSYLTQSTWLCRLAKNMLPNRISLLDVSILARHFMSLIDIILTSKPNANSTITSFTQA